MVTWRGLAEWPRLFQCWYSWGGKALAGAEPTRAWMSAALAHRLVVSTDLLARGVDLERVNLVACLDLPPDAATYMHRVGRTGRFGTRGIAVTYVDERELRTLQVERGGERRPGAHMAVIAQEVAELANLRASLFRGYVMRVEGNRRRRSWGDGPSWQRTQGRQVVWQCNRWFRPNRPLMTRLPPRLPFPSTVGLR